MRWTDRSGRPYGEDPYGGAGYTYPHGYEYSGGTTTDTSAMPRDPVQLAQRRRCRVRRTAPTNGVNAASGSCLRRQRMERYGSLRASVGAEPPRFDVTSTGARCYAAGAVPRPV